MVGLCHGVFDTARYLAQTLGVPFDTLRYTAVGINHLTWFTEVRAAGRDAMPALRRVAAERVAQAPAMDAPPGSVPAWVRGSSPYGNGVDPFAWRLLLDFGAFPAPLDRHVTEFFPQFFRDGTYYGMLLGVDAFSLEGTIQDGDEGYEAMKAAAFSPVPFDAAYFAHLGGEHEQVVDIILSIRADRGKVYSANLPNAGQVPNLPAGAIVEAPALADATGLHPLMQPPLPPAIAGSLATRYQWVETIVEAALEGSRDKFIQALVLDGYVTSLDRAAALAGDLLAAQADYLPWVDQG